jgi:hypothetical protein
MRAGIFAAATCLAFASGCGLPTSDLEPVVENTCSSNDACGPNGACVDGTCLSVEADLPGLYVTIDLPAQADYAGATSTLLFLEESGVAFLPGAGGGVRNHDLVTSELVEVSGQMTTAECAGVKLGADGQLPVSMDLYPVGQPAGIPQTVYSVNYVVGSDGGAATSHVPKGTYDVHIRPATDDGETPDVEGCSSPPPPALLPHQLIDGTTSVSVDGIVPRQLTGAITTGGFNLDKWRVDLVENQSGRIISTAHALDDLVDKTGSDYTFALEYWSGIVESEGIDAVIRLTPDDTQHLAGMPVILWKLSSVDLFGTYEVSLDVSGLSDVNAQPISVSGSVLDASSSAKVSATVVVQSQELLNGDIGDTVFYKRTLETDGDGNIANLNLLPGTYQVAAVPTSNPELAITTTAWEFREGEVNAEGRAILLNPKASLLATAITPQGQPAHSMPAVAQASAAPSVTYRESVLSISELQPTAATGITDLNGRFAVNLDPGNFDVFVRPGEESNLPWLVEPRVNINSAQSSLTGDLGQLTITHPVVLAGNILSPMGDALPGATIRAWLALPNLEDEGALPTAVQIGETTASASGAYRLLLPASISQ